jgi:hypothetical protein
MAEYQCELEHLGAGVKAHREMLGVPFDALKAYVSVGRVHGLLRVESAARPAVAHIEIHHQAMLMAWVESETAPGVQLAKREQWYANEYDEGLWVAAKALNPAVTWWWGVRSQDRARGAWCHLCSALIHSYDVGRGVTRPVRLAIMNHRFDHYTGSPRVNPGQQKGSAA